MNPKTIPYAVLVAGALLFAGCVTSARKYKAPDIRELVETGQNLSVAVAKANLAASKAAASLKTVEDASRQQRARIDALPPKLSELLRISPLELRPVIEAIQVDVAELQTGNAQLEANIVNTKKAQSELGTELEKTNAFKNEHLTKQADFIAKADLLAQKATDESARREEVEKKLRWYQLRWWGGFIALGASILVAILLYFLKGTATIASIIK